MSSNETYLMVEAGGRTFAVAGSRVLEVRRYADAADARLADLSRVLGGPSAAVGPATCVVMIDAGLARTPAAVGLVVDGATGIVSFRPEDLLDPPDFGPRVRLPYLAALARSGDGFAIVLDVERLLSQVLEAMWAA